MVWGHQVFVICVSLVAYGFADLEVNKFMGKAFVPAMPPASSVQPVGEIPAISLGTARHVPLAHPSPLTNMQREVAELEKENFAINSELQQFRSQIATVASIQSQKQSASADASGPQLAGVFGIAAVVGASLSFIIDELAKKYARSMRSGIGAELQLAGVGDGTIRMPSRSSVPMMNAFMPAPPPSEEATPEPRRRAALMAKDHASRREVLAAFSTALLAAPAVAADQPTPYQAPQAADGAKLWFSGKSDPLRPTSKDKSDGTKKDNKYLACIKECVPRQQGPTGPDQRSREDCYGDCQQECCFTYEQCTYKIRGK